MFVCAACGCAFNDFMKALQGTQKEKDGV